MNIPNDILEKDMAMQPTIINMCPGQEYFKEHREFQGIPTIERTKQGHFWVAFYSGGTGEGDDNYVALIKSVDGEKWSNPKLVIDPPGKVRAFDPCLWMDPLQRLWLFWSQSYTWYDGRAGVWATVCSDPDSENPNWSSPRRIANGVMMNKPTVLSTGAWLMPCAVWGYKQDGSVVDWKLNSMEEERFSNVYCSYDQGKSFQWIGGADVPDRHFDEHMFIERKDKSIWMLVRTFYGIGESISTNGGRSWTPGKDTGIKGPDSRFFIRRLKSGNLLLVNHYNFTGRNNLTAMISEDDGTTWKGFLVLDGRENVSYPDGVQDDDGTIYIIYDRERYKDKEILMATFTEEDVLMGKAVTTRAKLKQLIEKAGKI